MPTQQHKRKSTGDPPSISSPITVGGTAAKTPSETPRKTPPKAPSKISPTTPSKLSPKTSSKTLPKTTTKPQEKIDTQFQPAYVSPVKRVKQALELKVDKQVVHSVGELKKLYKNNSGTAANLAASVILQARVVWTTFEEVKTGPVARMHLVDIQAPENLDEMHQTLRDRYSENKFKVDQYLATASLYGVSENTKGIPSDGSVITIHKLWALNLFLDQACQFTTSLSEITVTADL